MNLRIATGHRLVFLCQHDRDHALGDGLVCCIWRMVREALIEIIDLEKDHLPIGFERTEVVLFIRIVGVTEIVIHSDRFDDTFDSFCAEPLMLFAVAMFQP